MSADFASNEEVIQAARRNLKQAEWDYLVGGVESETTMRRNRLAFDRLAFRPRVLRDVSKVDPSATFLGRKMRIPVMLAPVGGLHRFTPEGGVAAAKAATQFGTTTVVSTVTEPSLEKIAEAADGSKVFQLYIRGDWEWIRGIIGRVKEAGYEGFCLTVDNPYPSRRERPMVHHSTGGRVGSHNLSYQAALTWETMDRIKDAAGMPFMLKGVATAEDAALAIEHGVDVIWVSNHGGRQLYHQPGTMDMLPEIADAVDGKAGIVLDGGIQRGTDILKAIALGADAVAIGKLQGWGLAAGGVEGLVQVLEILEDEMVSAMGQLGVTSVGQLTPAYVQKAEPVTDPHEMSGWVNIPGGRIL